MSLIVGKKYRPKEKFDRCDKCKAATYVVMTFVNSYSCQYDIYDSEGKKTTSCWGNKGGCYFENNLEPFDDVLKPEDLKPGDWIECIKAFSGHGIGEKFRIVCKTAGETFYDVENPSTGFKTNWNIVLGAYFRKCSPPEEKIACGGTINKPVPMPDVTFDSLANMVHGLTGYDYGTNWMWGGHRSGKSTAYKIIQEAYAQLSDKPSTSPTPSFMDTCVSVIRKARDLALSPIERKYRKLNLKDQDGLTREGRDVFVDLLFQKFGKDLMDPVVRKLDTKDCDEE